LNGICKWYFESGKLKAEGTFKDGKQDAISNWYYESGTLRETANFKDGTLLSATCYDEIGIEMQCPEK